MPISLSALAATGALLVAGMASAESIGQFAAHQDIGAVKRAGAAGYDDKPSNTASARPARTPGSPTTRCITRTTRWGATSS